MTITDLILQIMDDAIVEAEDQYDYEKNEYKIKGFLLPSDLPEDTKKELHRYFRHVLFEDEVMDLRQKVKKVLEVKE